MAVTAWAWIGVLLAVSGTSAAACDKAAPSLPVLEARASEKPLQVLPWSGQGRARWECGCSGDAIWMISGQSKSFDAWKWKDGLLEKVVGVKLPETVRREDGLLEKGVLDFVWAGKKRYFMIVAEGARVITLTANEAQVNEPLRSWSASDSQWGVCFMYSSPNGEYVALASAPEDGNVPNPRYKIRLLNVATLTMSDVMILGGDQPIADNVRRVIPSDDGAYIAVAGWDNGVAMIDARHKKLLWSKRPPSEISTTYAVFGPGNEVVYAGGGEGCVYEMAVADGEVVRRWFASPTGKSEYGHRISAIAISPDGKHVAAGTGPAGLVFVIEPKSGKAVKVLNHGGSTISLVHFSPDSRRLASFAAGTLKVWDVGEPAAGNPAALPGGPEANPGVNPAPPRPGR